MLDGDSHFDCLFDIIGTVEKPVPQVHRQIRELRRTMVFAAVAVLVMSSVILFARLRFDTSDIPLSVQTPLIAPLGFLPTMTPVFLILVEIFGTSRILAEAHPFGPGRGREGFDPVPLFGSYLFATLSSRLGLNGVLDIWKAACRIFRVEHEHPKYGTLMSVPAASLCLLEKLGVCTAFTLVDDELACDHFSTPQQLLIPSANGLKLLDLCPVYDDDIDSEDESIEEKEENQKRGASSVFNFHDSDSDSEVNAQAAPGQRSIAFGALRRRRKRRRRRAQSNTDSIKEGTEDEKDGVEFEDPLWWQHLPSLKCIGLASLVFDSDGESVESGDGPPVVPTADASDPEGSVLEALVRHVACKKPHKKQLRSLAHCIGFSTDSNMFGPNGDLSFFKEKLRLQIIESAIVRERLDTDSHALPFEDSRSWGMLRSDATSIIIGDSRTSANQLLTIGDPRVVATLCHEAWQGEHSTILPLSPDDRKAILDIANDWALSDLDVSAFSYSPLPRTYDGLVDGQGMVSGHSRTW